MKLLLAYLAMADKKKKKKKNTDDLMTDLVSKLVVGCRVDGYRFR